MRKRGLLRPPAHPGRRDGGSPRRPDRCRASWSLRVLRACPYRRLCLCVYSSDPFLLQTCPAPYRRRIGVIRGVAGASLSFSCAPTLFTVSHTNPGYQSKRFLSVKKRKGIVKVACFQKFFLVLLRGKDFRVGDVGTGAEDLGRRAKEVRHRTSRTQPQERLRQR